VSFLWVIAACFACWIGVRYCCNSFWSHCMSVCVVPFCPLPPLLFLSCKPCTKYATIMAQCIWVYILCHFTLILALAIPLSHLLHLKHVYQHWVGNDTMHAIMHASCHCHPLPSLAPTSVVLWSCSCDVAQELLRYVHSKVAISLKQFLDFHYEI